MRRKNSSMRKKKVGMLVSVLCGLCVLAVCVGMYGYRDKLFAGNSGDKAAKKADLPDVTRGVIRDISEIPSYKRTNYDNNVYIRNELGSKENPLVILEVVPNKSFAEFGYLISGCEPIAVEDMFGQGIDGLDSDIGTDIVTTTPTIATFFAEEPEAQPSAYKDTEALDINTNYGTALRGYYERVPDGEGYFKQNDNNDIIKVNSGEGDIIWHTICEPEMPEYEKYFDTEQNDEKKRLSDVGDRIYTTRENTESDQAYNTPSGKFCYYKNHDVLLRNSLGCSEQEAKNYCIVIKTITPEELNNNPTWANYADLFVLSPVSHDTKYLEWYNGYCRNEADRHQDSNLDKNVNFVNTEENPNRDVSWSVVRKMYDRIAEDSDQNFAAIMMDDHVYEESYLTGSTKSSSNLEVYDWNLNKTGKTFSGGGNRSNNNLYKLAVMLFSMKPDLFKNIYLNSKGPKGELISSEGKFTLRDSDNDEYWSMYTFLLAGEDCDFNQLYNYWNGKWSVYDTYGNITIDRVKVNGHVFTYNSDMNVTQTFMKDQIDVTSSDKFDSFEEWLREHPKKGEESKTTVAPSEAVRYILNVNGKGSDIDIVKRGHLKILDIEPCFDCANGYVLQESYIRMMIPDFKGDIQIKHMTTAEFIGSAEDLNSTYDMIFMGLDYGAYNTKEQNLKYPAKDGSGENWVTDVYTVWNDSKMNGKIYFHTGDKVEANYQDVSGKSAFDVEFLWSETTQQNVKSRELRFPGNDITKLKQKELENYLKAGYPIVAVPYLYDEDAIRIDQKSNICKFIHSQKNKSVPLYKTTDSVNIYNVVSKDRPSVEFLESPEEYVDITASDNKDKEKKYLPKDTAGRSIIQFKFKVTDSDKSALYQCKIYLDQNQDGKYETGENAEYNECYYISEPFQPGEEPTAKCLLSKQYVGLAQWKIVVSQVKPVNGEYAETGIRFVKTGCSVVKSATGEKKNIHVLQIMPDKNYDKGGLNLEKNGLFTKYYKSLEDYSIQVDAITVEMFQKYFESAPFHYDYTKPISYDLASPNPGALSKEPVTITDSECPNAPASQNALFDDYNMIIIGFGDMYHHKDISNKNGAVDFIKYFIDSGKSVLFVHDLTSMCTTSGNYGYSANILLRDTMGMNRYKSVSNRLSESERNQLLEYQKGFTYDTSTDLDGNTLEANHGYNYFTIKRLVDEKNTKNQKMSYRYLPGFCINNDTTDLVSEVNKGQITQYPFKIGSDMTVTNSMGLSTTMKGFKVANTHAQYYQLNMEDPEVTVWYCLADDNKKNGNATSLTYGVSPNDTANNYYIYSKKNVFYSGVGHDTVNNDMEAKLFINTMIAAYRAAYIPPMVDVLNSDAVLTDVNDITYQITNGEEYNTDNSGELLVDDKIKIEFSPEELNGVSTNMTLSLCYVESKEDTAGDYIGEIYRKNGTKVPSTTTSDGKIEYKLTMKDNMKDFYFYYPKEKLNSSTDKKRNVRFTIINDKTKKPGITTLNMTTQALFQLD